MSDPTHASGPAGVFAAALTPFTQDLEPNPKAFVAHCRWLLDNGCDGLAPLGTTGEANSLTAAQRLSLIEAAAEAGLPMERMIAGGGSCALAEAVHMTKSLIGLGCAGVLTLPPFYYKNPSEDGLFAFFSELIQRVGDTRYRLYLYHFPVMSTVPFPPSLIARLLKEYPGTVAGLKDSSGDWSYSEHLLKEYPGFGVFSGSELFLLDNLRHGGPGCISASTNATAPLARLVRENWQGDKADELQAAMAEVRMTLQKYPMIMALKYLKSRLTGDQGWLNALPPQVPFTDEQARQLMADLEALPQFAPVLKLAVKAA
ncbi:MAG: dihydrodipicolinate synthase family protein [Rhodospirillales bacterium]|nr:dihydrodipicolinate synthase family protein [Rhodospirillales bacterium]